MADRALWIRTVLASWTLAIGIDLFFNAGVFSGLFDQQQEPVLLPDGDLFARVPFAYALLLGGVGALAWLINRLDIAGPTAAGRLGGMMGVVVAGMGTAYLWTAVDLSLRFVASAIVVQVVQFAAAGAAIGYDREGGSTRRIVAVAIACATGGVIAQNVL